MIKAYDMASWQPIGDEQTSHSEITAPPCVALPQLRLATVHEELAVEDRAPRYPGAVIMAPISVLISE